jgi:glycosyltransferase involved in cell wall biosynthesis
MKVALINSTFGGISGSGRHIYNLYEHLKGKCEFQMFDVNSIGYLNIPKLKSLSFYYKLKKIKINADIIHVHNPKFSGVVKNHKNAILTIHGDYITELTKQYGALGSIVTNFLKKNVELFNVITTVNPHWAKERGWRYIPNGVGLDKIQQIKPAEARYVLFVGRKEKIKGYELFKEISKNIPYPSKMLFNRPWEEVISFMKSAYCVVMPSEVEGFPTVILEAWASRCPVIASKIPELQSISEDSIYFAERTVKDFSNAIHKVIEDGEGIKLIEQASKTVKKYDWSNVAKQYYELYCSIYEKS